MTGAGRLAVIAAGGTGGHMFPAQALAQALLARGWRVALATDARGLRYAGGFPADVARRALASATFARGGAAARLAAPFAIGAGALAALGWFLRDRPAVVAGFGGYPALPALAAAWTLGLPRLIHEQNGVLGRVNRRFAARVDAVACGTWPLAVPAPRGARLLDMGNPVRPAVRALAGAPYAPPDAGPVELVVVGGSQGAGAFARLVPAALAGLAPELRARLRLTQQARPEDADAVRADLAAAGVAAQVAPFFDDLPQRLARAQLAICRAGASTLAELAALGRPAILIPYPAAAEDHQTANARALADAGAALLAPEADLTPARLGAHVAALLADPGRLAAMAAAAAARGRPDAADRLADLVETLAARRSPP